MLSEVYKNVLKMCEKRKIKLDEPADENAAMKSLKHQEYLLISGVRTKSPMGLGEDPRPAVKFYAVLVAPGSRYVSKATDLYKMLKELKLDHKNRDYPHDPPLEIVIITAETISPATAKTISSFASPTVYINLAEYKIFKMDITEYWLTPQQEIMSEADIEDFCYKNVKTRDNFPKIESGEPMAVWLGLRPGMCIRSLRPSATAGYAPAYRYCIRSKTHTGDAEDQ